MLISALNDYYDILYERGLTPKCGYSFVDISFIISLTLDGEIDSIIDWRNQKIIHNKKNDIIIYYPKKEIMPFRTQKSTIDFNVVEHRPLYIFGLEDKAGKFEVTAKAKNSHQCFVEGCKNFFSDIDSDLAKALCKFVDKWTPDEEIDNPILLELGKDYSKYFSFCLSNDVLNLLHNDPLVKQKWENIYNVPSPTAQIGQCAISGKETYISRVHYKVTGITGGLSSGCSLVSFKGNMGCSYDKTQAHNANISQEITERYYHSLNYLTSRYDINMDKYNIHNAVIGNMTVVNFAMTKDDKYDETLNAFIYRDKMEYREVDDLLCEIIRKVSNAGLTNSNVDFLEDIDSDIDFYIFGLIPNSSRMAIKFVYKNKFGKLSISFKDFNLVVTAFGIAICNFLPAGINN